jgi:hypothetical protein
VPGSPERAPFFECSDDRSESDGLLATVLAPC